MTALSDDLRQRIAAYFPHYPTKRAVTLPALHLVQDELRSVSPQAMREIAELLELHPAEIADTMSFYGFFREADNPLGERRVWVCRSISCMLRGGEELLADLSERLGCSPGGMRHTDAPSHSCPSGSRPRPRRLLPWPSGGRRTARPEPSRRLAARSPAS